MFTKIGFGRVLALALSVVLAFSLGGPGVAQAANTTPDTATPLDVTTNSVSSSLVGSPGGAYRYYRVSYQGGNAPVAFNLTYQPSYGGGNNALGFNLYGPSSLSFAGQVTSTSGSSATASYTLVNGAAMTILVQVYNYTNGGSIDYTLTISGLSGGSATSIVAKNNTSPSQATSVTTTNASIGGTLLGSSAGSFQFYALSYPGGNAPLAISMNVSPTYTGQGQAYGFNVFRTLPNGQSQLVATSGVAASDANSTTLSATVTQPAAAAYQLQIFNYWPGVSVSYGVQVTGVVTAAPAISGNTDAGHAVVLNSTRPGASETLAGSGGGAFNDFLVSYPGSNSAFDVAVTYQSTGGAAPSTLGFNVYEGSTLVATIHPLDDGSGVLAAVWSYSDPNPHTFGIQVFNYQSGTTASYSIYESGSK